MDLFLNWFDLAPGVSDTEFCDALDAYLRPLKERGEIAGSRGASSPSGRPSWASSSW